MTQLLKLTACLMGLIVAIACDSRPGPLAPDTDVQLESGGIVRASVVRTTSSDEFFDDVVDSVTSGDQGELENDGSCARSPGFYCQNQNGKNPHMTAEEFEMFAAMAASFLASVEELDAPAEVAGAVCDTSDQLFRHLAALALNLASGRVETSTPHANADFPTVGDAFNHAVAVANGALEVTREERKRVKRMIEQINENVSVGEEGECAEMEDEDEDPGEVGSVSSCSVSDPKNQSKILICHKARHTLSISISAWPAHQAHSDTCGPCS